MKTKIKEFKDACDLLKLDPKHLPIVDHLPERHRNYIVSNYKLVIITEALVLEYSIQNKLKALWVADFTIDTFYKYCPWFHLKKDSKHPSGFAFSNSSYFTWDTYTDVAARLLLPTAELAKFSADQFSELHLDVITPAQPTLHENFKIEPIINIADLQGEYSIEQIDGVIAEIKSRVKKATEK